MVRAVIQDKEESVGPLADGEVARLLLALNNAEFTRSDKHDLAKNSKFEQRSLIEIAGEAEKRKDKIQTGEQNQGPDINCDNLEGENFSDAKSDSSSRENLEPLKAKDTVPEQTIRDITSKQKTDEQSFESGFEVRDLTTNPTSVPETDGTESGIRGLTTNPTSVPETDGTEPGIRGLTTNPTSSSETDGTEPGIRGLTTNPTSSSETDGPELGIRGLTSLPHGEIEDPAKSQATGELTSNSSGLDDQTAKNSFETVNEAFERGKTEGISEGRFAAIAETKESAVADANAELAHVVDTFKDVLNSLARPKSIQTEALSSSINATILKLASQRAGIQIDELPEAFSDRIKALVTDVGQELADGKIHLNEDDYDTMKPYLADLGYEVVVNSNLMRGDVTLQFDGVEAHDVAANRLANDSSAGLNDAADDTALDDDATAATNDAALANMSTGDVSQPPPDESDS